MIEVKRYNYPERTIKYRNGCSKFVPARYQCYYFYNGKEIARYDSKDDTIYLKTKLIDKDFSKSTYNRALYSSNKDIFMELFSMLGVDETSKFSEYMSM